MILYNNHDFCRREEEGYESSKKSKNRVEEAVSFDAWRCLLHVHVLYKFRYMQRRHGINLGRIGPIYTANLGGFNVPKGVAVDSSGNVYVADSGNHRIQKLTLSTNTWSEWKKVGGGSGSRLGRV